MTELRNCKYRGCGLALPGTHRADAEYCNDLCRSREKNERRREASSTTRVDPASDGVGSRGGDVRSVDQAQILHDQHKAEWVARVRRHIAATLIETTYFHADDLDVLLVPSAHANVKGSQAGSFRSQGFMEKTGQERKVAHAAANGRKTPIFRITEKGRRELPKLLVGYSAEGRGQTPQEGTQPADATPSSVSGENGSGDGVVGPSPSPESAARLPGMEPGPYERMRDAA
jgi:hypothetical protein